MKQNLIIICTDEMRGDCLSIAGNRDVETPNIDALMRRGVYFSRHFTNHAKCAPSRASLMTGRYTHADGFRTIDQVIPADQPNLLPTLQSAGYETAVFGKNHCWSDFYDEGALDHHSYSDHYKPFFSDNWRKNPERIMFLADDVPEQMHYIGRTYAHHDDTYTAQAIDFLTVTRDEGRPFFLQLNIESPHTPYGAPEPYFSQYDRAKITPFPIDLPQNASLPFHANRTYRSTTTDLANICREIQATYYGMISHVDALVGDVVTALERENLFEDTVILFWSDHGDFAGQYGLGEKWDTIFSDCLVHVPCALIAPHLPMNHTVTSMTETVDLAPTLCELLGIEPLLPKMHGESLLPIVAGEKRKTAVFADGGHEDALLHAFAEQNRDVDWTADTHEYTWKHKTYVLEPDSMCRASMVRTDDYKLVIRQRGGNELYDMRSDRYEMNNLYGEAGYEGVTAELFRLWAEWRLRTDSTALPPGKFGA